MGETTDVGVAELLSVLARRGHTGRLHINANSEEVQVSLDRGQVIQVSSSHFHSRLGRVMVRLGLIGEVELDRAIRDQSLGQQSRPLGQILIERGLVTAKDLSRAAEEQATDALARIFGADLGTFFFSSDRSDVVKSGLASLNAEGIVLEASRRADEVATLRRILPSSDTLLVLDRNQLPRSGRLPFHEQRVVRIVAGSTTSIQTIVSELGDDEWAALRSIVSLRARGILSIAVASTESAPDPVVASGDPSRTVEDLVALMKSDPTETDHSWTPSITDVRASAPAGTLISAQLTRTVRDVVAAFNSGMPLLAFTYFSDEYFRRMAEMAEAEKVALRNTEPLAENEHQTFIGLKDARTLADGRISAIVITRLPGGPESKKVVIFATTDDSCLIDAIIESALERERHTQTTLLGATGMLDQDSRVLRRHL